MPSLFDWASALLKAGEYQEASVILEGLLAKNPNRVIEMCRKAGIHPPEFHEIAGSAVVKFHVPVGVTVQVTDQEAPQVTPQEAPQVTPQVARVLGAARSDCFFADLPAAAGLKDPVHFLKTHLEPLLFAGWIERTIPDKPHSSKQKYRLTENGRQTLDEWTGGA